MRLLSEITAEEAAERDRAYQFEKLTNEATDIRRSLAASGRTDADAQILRQIVALSADLSPNALTGSTPSALGSQIPSLAVARDFLQAVAQATLKREERLLRERAEGRANLEARLAAVEDALKEFA